MNPIKYTSPYISHPQFKMQNWLQNVKDKNWATLWVCWKTNKWPIRGILDTQNKKLIKVLCNWYGAGCTSECPFSRIIEKDQTDY